MLTLGIETSCDETSAAVVEGEAAVRSNIVASQYDLHGKYGGVVPELACRRHVEIIDKVVQAALDEAGATADQIGLIAVVKGPGLIGALLIGACFAKSFALGRGIPSVGINHLEAHLYACVMSDASAAFPAVGLVISGGHTTLCHVPRLGEYRLLGATLDDAVGESFDKVGALLGLPYLGGPLVEKLARSGDRRAVRFPRGMTKRRSYDFSYAGLKTAVLYRVKGYRGKRTDADVISEAEKADIAAGFQEAALDVLVTKSVRAAREFGARSILVGGGVSRNRRLRELFAAAVAKDGIPVVFPLDRLCTDNAAMVAGLGAWTSAHRPDLVGFNFDADPNLRLGRRV